MRRTKPEAGWKGSLARHSHMDTRLKWPKMEGWNTRFVFLLTVPDMVATRSSRCGAVLLVLLTSSAVVLYNINMFCVPTQTGKLWDTDAARIYGC